MGIPYIPLMSPRDSIVSESCDSHPPVLSFFVWRPVTSLDAAQIEKLPSPVLPLCECVATHPPPSVARRTLNSSSHRSFSFSSSAPFMSLHGEDDEGEGRGKVGWRAHLAAPLNATFGSRRIRSTSLELEEEEDGTGGRPGISDGELRSAGQTEAPPEFRSCIRTSRGMCAPMLRS